MNAGVIFQVESNKSKNKVYVSIYSQPAWDYISL